MSRPTPKAESCSDRSRSGGPWTVSALPTPAARTTSRSVLASAFVAQAQIRNARASRKSQLIRTVFGALLMSFLIVDHLVVRRVLNAIDDEHVDRAFRRFQLES